MHSFSVWPLIFEEIPIFLELSPAPFYFTYCKVKMLLYLLKEVRGRKRRKILPYMLIKYPLSVNGMETARLIFHDNHENDDDYHQNQVAELLDDDLTMTAMIM